MSNIDKRIDKQALRRKAEKATKGEWWSDSCSNEGTYGSGDDCMEGYTSYAVYDENNQILLDTLNSTAACINEEYNGECHVAWDEVGQRNAEFIAAANPTTVLALLDELEAKDRRIEEEIGRANREHHRGFMMACGHLKEHSNVHYADAAEMEIAALRNRINELESAAAAKGEAS